ncbi:unnamed protein product [Lactuca saligna]|uniref:Uncharacterized protein n=1 Tax=Lactuca saligna TaxID=75948 RepID=A0AA36E4Z9_LACSI|nr:unnamed protein product [Lactuca saligna]
MDVVKAGMELEELGITFSFLFEIRIGDGSDTLFWKWKRVVIDHIEAANFIKLEGIIMGDHTMSGADTWRSKLSSDGSFYVHDLRSAGGAAQTTRRLIGLKCVCFFEVRRHKNVCARSSPHRYGPTSSKIARQFHLHSSKFRRPTVTSDLSPHRPSPPSSPIASPVVACFTFCTTSRLQRIGWVYLKNKTGNIYNSQTNTFNLRVEEWDDFKKEHPKAASLKTMPLPFPDLCARLFDGNSATGNFRSYSTQSSSPPPSAASPSAASLSSYPNKRAKPSTPKAPSTSPSASSPDGTSVTADDLAFEMKKALQSLTKGYTIPQCLEKLEVLQLGPTDPLRFVAYHIFGGTMNMREMWMHLPDVPEILRGWLEMTGTSLGVLKDGKIVR